MIKFIILFFNKNYIFTKKHSIFTVKSKYIFCFILIFTL